VALLALHDLPAPAKLNAFLHVVGRREDGYHLLESAMLPLDWCDVLHVERRSDGRLARHDLGAALPPDDLCLRAARALQQASATPLGADISIDKRVPWGAGLGGGSSDAATVLVALNRLWDLRWPRERLAALGLTLGADVPFFLGPGPALARGVGERLEPLVVHPQWFAVVKPAVSLATAAVFAGPQLERTTVAARIEGFTGADGCAPWAYGRNDLQAAAEAACAEVAEARAFLAARFGDARMTGSGSAVFAWAGGGEEPTPAWPGVPHAGWTGRMCRSLAGHPLADW
jgi:4-diphosphocytidyl-2-C-methyl-D-erythritol kinase